MKKVKFGKNAIIHTKYDNTCYTLGICIFLYLQISYKYIKIHVLVITSTKITRHKNLLLILHIYFVNHYIRLKLAATNVP